MVECFDVFFQLCVGLDIVWLNVVLKYLFDYDLVDIVFLNERVNGLDEFVKSFEFYMMEYVEKYIGVDKDILIKVVWMIYEVGSVCVLWVMGVIQYIGGSDMSMVIFNLFFVIGNYGKFGVGLYLFWGYNNVQGVSDFGSMFDSFFGYEKVMDEKVCKKYEQGWGIDLL